MKNGLFFWKGEDSLNFIAESNVTAKISASDYYMSEINIDKSSTKKLVQQIGNKGLDKELLQVMNCLGQNIEDIKTLEYSYFHLGEKLQFSELSRGEKVFLVSYASKILGEIIYLQYDILQLTKTSLRKYYKEFKDCNSINIIYSTEIELNYLNMAMRGDIK